MNVEITDVVEMVCFVYLYDISLLHVAITIFGKTIENLTLYLPTFARDFQCRGL